MAGKTLFKPAVSLAKDGFIVARYLANSLSSYAATLKKIIPGAKKSVCSKWKYFTGG